MTLSWPEVHEQHSVLRVMNHLRQLGMQPYRVHLCELALKYGVLEMIAPASAIAVSILRIRILHILEGQHAREHSGPASRDQTVTMAIARDDSQQIASRALLALAGHSESARN